MKGAFQRHLDLVDERNLALAAAKELRALVKYLRSVVRHETDGSTSMRHVDAALDATAWVDNERPC